MSHKGTYVCEKDGKEVRLYHLTNGVVSADILNVGGAIARLLVPDKQGALADVMLGFGTLEEYLNNRCNFGCLVGRYANRIGHAHFELNGKSYDLVKNNGTASLHGGPKSWYVQVWDVDDDATDERTLTLCLTSPDGENFFPGKVEAKVVYHITDGNGLSLEYFAKSDQDTYVNMTNHSYFNMAGHAFGDCLGHDLQIFSSNYLPVDSALIPTGEVAPVEGTPFDFTQPKKIGRDIEMDDPQLKLGNGYDHNYCIDGADGTLRRCAVVTDPEGGRVMTVYTTMPGVQLYTANGLKGEFAGKDGCVYGKRAGYCLETQYWPDTPNKPDFPNGLLKAGEEYHHVTVYEFSCK